jgi:linoleoyl-CoA desaturase
MEQQKRVKFTNIDKTQFLKTLKQQVDNFFEENHLDKQANVAMVIKTISVLAVYLLPLGLMYIFHLPNWAVLLGFVVSGFGMAGVGMCVMHDANHGSYSRNALLNQLLGGTLNILGGYHVNWKFQHNILHHTYTNITHVDEDIHQRLKMRWSPFFQWYPVQKYQHIYAFFAYSLSTLSWVLMKDYKQFYAFYKNGVNKCSKAEYVWQLSKLIFYKLAYILYMLVIPIVVLQYHAGVFIGGFFLMHAVGGLMLSTVFQLAHIVEGAEFPMPNEKGQIENEWAIHQLLTTADFAHDNKFLVWYTGGLTHQIEHHIFPDICHIHYPKIAHIVKETAKEFGLPYNYNASYFKALGSHVRTLKKFGLQSDFDLANV